MLRGERGRSFTGSRAEHRSRVLGGWRRERQVNVALTFELSAHLCCFPLCSQNTQDLHTRCTQHSTCLAAPKGPRLTDADRRQWKDNVRFGSDGGTVRPTTPASQSRCVICPSALVAFCSLFAVVYDPLFAPGKRTATAPNNCGHTSSYSYASVGTRTSTCSATAECSEAPRYVVKH